MDICGLSMIIKRTCMDTFPGRSRKTWCRGVDKLGFTWIVRNISVIGGSLWGATWRSSSSGAQRPRCRGGSRYVEWCWGFPYLKNIGCLVSCFLVSKIIGFLVSRISGFNFFLVSWFQRFKKSLNVFVGNLVHITNCPFHVFLLDIALRSKIFEILLNGSSELIGARLVEICQNQRRVSGFFIVIEITF